MPKSNLDILGPPPTGPGTPGYQSPLLNVPNLPAQVAPPQVAPVQLDKSVEHSVPHGLPPSASGRAQSTLYEQTTPGGSWLVGHPDDIYYGREGIPIGGQGPGQRGVVRRNFGIPGKKLEKPNIGLDIQKRLKFLPEGLRPRQGPYLPPDYMDRLARAVADGRLDQRQFDKANEVVSNWYNQSVTGTQVQAHRAGMDVEKQNVLDQSALMEQQADAKLSFANKQLELVDRLEKSDVFYEVSRQKAKKHLDQQIGLMRQKIERIESQNINPFGDGWGVAFATIGTALGTAGSILSRTPQQSASMITGVIDRGLAAMAQKTNSLKFGLQAEFNIYNLMRQGMHDDASAYSAARVAMIKRARTEIEAMGMRSSSEATRMRAQQLSQNLGLQERAEEKKLQAQLVMQAEQKKQEAFGRMRGGAAKIKKNAFNLLQSGNRPYGDPIKGHRYLQYTDSAGNLIGGFLPEKMAFDYEKAIRGVDGIQSGLDTLKRLHAQGSYFSAADREAEKRALRQIELSYKDAFAMGPHDKGSQVALEPFAPEVLGPLTNMPLFGGETSKRLQAAQRGLDELKTNMNNRIQGNIKPGEEKMFVDPATGQAKMQWVYDPPTSGRARQQTGAGQQATGAQHTGNFQMKPVQ